jgi:uncharacterized membrane protein YhhN
MWVILVCALSFARPHDGFDSSYTVLILSGLLLSLAGDVLLIPQENPRAFLGGLVAFLLAHVLYIAAFVHLQSSLLRSVNISGEIAAGVGLSLVAVTVYRYLRPGLGDMKWPVIGYIFAISTMLHRALGIVWAHSGPSTQPALIALGALLFYLSDAILAINIFRLRGQMPHYKVLNLSTYYTGQLLIALSTWFF